MRIPGLKTIRKVGRHWRSRLVNGGVILGYHRIADATGREDPFGICVSPALFAAQMAYLRQQMQPLPLLELVERALGGTLPLHAVAVTFDDGYADNLHLALPILAQYEIPATLFVTTAVLEGEFWWDELVRLWRCRSESWWETAVPHLSAHDLLALYHWLLPLPAAVQREQLDHLWHLVGGRQAVPPTTLTADELCQLAASKWFEIGSHTVTHPLLPDLTPDAQAYEIHASRNILQEMIGQDVRLFSYPNGRYTAHTIALTQSAGYTLACASYQDIVWRKSNRFCLPRVWAKNKKEWPFNYPHASLLSDFARENG